MQNGFLHESLSGEYQILVEGDGDRGTEVETDREGVCVRLLAEQVSDARESSKCHIFTTCAGIVCDDPLFQVSQAPITKAAKVTLVGG